MPALVAFPASICGASIDTTIVVVDDFGTPSAQAAMQRVRHGILVTTPGATTEADVNGLGGLGITVTDLTYLVNLVFRTGSQPPLCE